MLQWLQWFAKQAVDLGAEIGVLIWGVPKINSQQKGRMLKLCHRLIGRQTKTLKTARLRLKLQRAFYIWKMHVAERRFLRNVETLLKGVVERTAVNEHAWTSI